MDESFICECGHAGFWFFWDRVRCQNCFNEYKETRKVRSQREINSPWIVEYWLRRFNLEKKEYNPNWEKSKITYKNV